MISADTIPVGPDAPPLLGEPPVAMFVYCKTLAADDAMLAALRRLDQRLVAHGWPAATLWRRPLAAHGAARTWMMVHAPQPPARAAALEAAIEAAARTVGLAALIDGVLHVERFCPCD